MAEIPQIGQPAPNFTAIAHTGQAVNLADFRGSWLVIYFYPKDDTPGCTTEAKDFTDLLEEFDRLGVKVVGVSPDSTKAHCKFIAKHDLKVTLLSDPEHQVAEAYGAWRLKKFMGKEYMGIARSTFLISPQQAIAHPWPDVKAKGHAQAVLNKASELIIA